MTSFSAARVAAGIEHARNGETRTEQGRRYEDLVCYFLGAIPGVSVTARDQQNAFATEEIDIVFWNDRRPRGLHFLQEFLFVECKNWSSSVASQDVSYFVQKLRSRGLTFGLLIAANGITGLADDRTAAYAILASALQDGIRVVVLTNDDLLSVSTPPEIVDLIKTKLCGVVLRGVGF